MPQTFTPADVTRIAKLARIALTDAEITATASQLATVFALIETMQAIDTDGVEPLTTPLAALGAFPLRLREDTVTADTVTTGTVTTDAITALDRRAAFQRPAPSVEDGLYLVPKVIE